MTDRAGHGRPLVFLSFAGPDRPKAERLRHDLAARGFGVFVDEHSIQPGEDVLSAINRALSRSSYCVLLWSRHTQDRPWVEVEWTAALFRGLNEKRSFLFVIRLDQTEPPMLLAARKYLDAFPDWDAAVARLADSWLQDRQVGTPVFPAPTPVVTARSGDVSTIELYVRNRAFSVSHVVAAPSTVTGPELLSLVEKALDLPDGVSKSGGIVSARFAYELWYRGSPLPGVPLTRLGIGNGATVDLVVRCDFGSHGEAGPTMTFRDGLGPRGPVISPGVARALVNAAFGHLMP